LRKNRGVIEDQNEKLEKVKLEREEQIEAMNSKILVKDQEVRGVEQDLEAIENEISEIVKSALA
jgi:hypothetical protein